MSPQPFFEWRGSPIRVNFDVRALAELGYEVDLLTMPVGLAVDLPRFVHLHRTVNPFRLCRLAIGPSLPKAIYDVFLFFHAAGLVLRRRYAALHGVEEGGIIAAALGRIFRIPTVFEKHSDPRSHRGGILKNIALAAYALVERVTIRLCDSVIVTGPGLVAQTRLAAPAKPTHHVFDIPSSTAVADRKVSRDINQKLKRAPREVLAMYVGSFAAYQGIDLMFESMPATLNLCSDIRFVVVGGSEPEIAARKAWLEKQGIAEHVVFLGKLPPDHLPNYLDAADIFLSPRIAGANTPLKILDYLKADGAIVAGDTPANRLLLDENTAVLVPPTPAGFAEGIARLARDRDLRARLSAQGQKLARTRYSFDEFKRRLGACYEALAQPKEGVAPLLAAALVLGESAAIRVEEVCFQTAYMLCCLFCG